MNFPGGGEHHRSHVNHASTARSKGPHSSAPGVSSLLESSRPGDVRGFVHRRILGGLGGLVGGILSGSPLAGITGAIRGFVGGGSTAVPQVTQCPPGFFLSGSGCVPRAQPQLSLTGPLRQQIGLQSVPGGAPFGRAGAFAQPTLTQAGFRESQGLAADPAAGEAVMGRFGAGFEPTVEDIFTRRCGRGAVLGVDGLCYNKRDLRNSDRFWPRGRRPLLTGGEVRAISVASSAAKKLERKQKQLMELGLLKRPTRSRRAAPAGHRAVLTHDGRSEH